MTTNGVPGFANGTPAVLRFMQKAVNGVDVWVDDPASGTPATNFALFATDASGANPLQTIAGLALDPSGNVYVADPSGNKIVEFNGSGTLVGTFASSATSPLSDPQYLKFSTGFDGTTSLYVSSNNNGSNGQVLRYAY